MSIPGERGGCCGVCCVCCCNYCRFYNGGKGSSGSSMYLGRLKVGINMYANMYCGANGVDIDDDSCMRFG